MFVNNRLVLIRFRRHVSRIIVRCFCDTVCKIRQTGNRPDTIPNAAGNKGGCAAGPGRASAHILRAKFMRVQAAAGSESRKPAIAAMNSQWRHEVASRPFCPSAVPPEPAADAEPVASCMLSGRRQRSSTPHLCYASSPCKHKLNLSFVRIASAHRVVQKYPLWLIIKAKRCPRTQCIFFARLFILFAVLWTGRRLDSYKPCRQHGRLQSSASTFNRLQPLLPAVLVAGPTATQNSLFLPHWWPKPPPVLIAHTHGGMARLSRPEWPGKNRDGRPAKGHLSQY